MRRLSFANVAAFLMGLCLASAASAERIKDIATVQGVRSNQLIGVNARIRFVRRVQIENGPQHWSLVEDHSRIVQAIVDRDRERGIEILRSHISLTFAEARAVLKEALLKIFLPEQTAPRRGRARSRK